MRARLPAYDGPMREVEQWDPGHESGKEGTHVRWDVKWRDPASGWIWQYHVDAYDFGGANRDFLRETARACFTRIINRKMGVARMINLTHELPLPRHVPGRYV